MALDQTLSKTLRAEPNMWLSHPGAVCEGGHVQQITVQAGSQLVCGVECCTGRLTQSDLSSGRRWHSCPGLGPVQLAVQQLLFYRYADVLLSLMLGFGITLLASLLNNTSKQGCLVTGQEWVWSTCGSVVNPGVCA